MLRKAICLLEYGDIFQEVETVNEIERIKPGLYFFLQRIEECYLATTVGAVTIDEEKPYKRHKDMPFFIDSAMGNFSWSLNRDEEDCNREVIVLEKKDKQLLLKMLTR